MLPNLAPNYSVSSTNTDDKVKEFAMVFGFREFHMFMVDYHLRNFMNTNVKMGNQSICIVCRSLISGLLFTFTTYSRLHQP
jgi:hypothetical protein